MSTRIPLLSRGWVSWRLWNSRKGGMGLDGIGVFLYKYHMTLLRV